jgi:hypothetical protein
MRRSIWHSTAGRIAAVALLLGLLAGCRVDTNTLPGGTNATLAVTNTATNYPGPASKPTAVRTAPVQRTAVPVPTPTVAPPIVPTSGEVAFSITIVHTSENHGEAIPCG